MHNNVEEMTFGNKQINCVSQLQFPALARGDTTKRIKNRPVQ
ncbi:Uncharacterised protein [Corynebacterium minutissimum]|uniref:Uncharacterized protein n=1 Tax=Corynebacterium minutissimum TaxID=38301 RepID=A0A376D137_9CORY|nr:Uncharacterised protein [Corynebacterium minutissimum]